MSAVENPFGLFRSPAAFPRRADGTLGTRFAAVGATALAYCAFATDVKTASQAHAAALMAHLNALHELSRAAAQWDRAMIGWTAKVDWAGLAEDVHCLIAHACQPENVEVKRHYEKKENPADN